MNVDYIFTCLSAFPVVDPIIVMLCIQRSVPATRAQLFHPETQLSLCSYRSRVFECFRKRKVTAAEAVSPAQPTTSRAVASFSQAQNVP